jgi:hypothetical protein
LYSIADVFRYKNGYSRALIFKKPVTAFRAKKGGVFIDVECAIKNSKAHVTILPLPPP